MEANLEVKRRSRARETSKVVKQKILSPRANQTLNFQDKQQKESTFGQHFFDQHHEIRHNAGDRLIPQTKSCGTSQNPWIGRKANDDDELVKHMSNLPAYLQRVEKGDNIQVKALNFGVLDWEHLEKWKHNKTFTPAGGDIAASSSGSKSSFKPGGLSTLSSRTQSKSLAQCEKQPVSHYPHLNSSHEGGLSQDVKKSQGKVKQQDFKGAPWNTFYGQQNLHQTDKPSSRNYSKIKLERRRRKDEDKKITSEKGTSSSDLRKHGFPRAFKDETSAQSSVGTNRLEELQASSEYYIDKKHCPGKHKSVVLIFPKHSPGKASSETVQPSEPREANHESFSDDFSPEEVHSTELYSETPNLCTLPVIAETSSKSGIRPRSMTRAQSMDLPNDACSFLHPNETYAMLSQGKFTDEAASSMKPSSANAVDTSKRLNYEGTEPSGVKDRHSSPNCRFGLSFGGISRSLSSKESPAVARFTSTMRSDASDGFSFDGFLSAESYSESLHSCPLPVRDETNTESDLRRHSLSTAYSTELRRDDPCTYKCPTETPNTPSSAHTVMNFKRLDQDATGPAAVRGRQPSHSRRFSLSLGKISRSFSSKENPTVPHLSSTYATVKSGPVSSEMSDSLNNASRNKANTHSRARSSPLRRLIEPLIRNRVSNSNHYPETIQPLTEILNLTSKVISSTGSLHSKKHEASTVQACLQVTVRNGLPFFKLEDNKSVILVAMKKLTSYGKDEAGWIYTFYSVRQIKKSGSWLNQGQKEKNYGFGYNVMGQMKVFSSQYPDLTLQSSKDQFTVREYVLYGVDPGQADQETEELMPNREVAAVIVKTPIGNSFDGGHQKDNDNEELIGKGFVEWAQEDWSSFERGETEKFNSTTVILPGGIHGLPHKGVPSPLIDRWKSHGLCDCGGWDVGCKLRILANDDQSFNLLGPSVSCSTPDHLDLFDQEGTQDNRPIFSLARLKKGIYSVEFCASISLLQAFSICVAVISSQKSWDFPELNNPSEAKVRQESTFCEYDVVKGPTNVPSPPRSPVGRV